MAVGSWVDEGLENRVLFGWVRKMTGLSDSFGATVFFK